MAKKRDKAPRRCVGRNATGRPCGNPPLPGSARCWHHSYTVPGRPSKLTPELLERIVDGVRRGAYFEVAAQAAGIDKTTFYRWLRRGEQAIANALAQAEEHNADVDAVEPDAVYDLIDVREWPYVDFRHAIESAAAVGELELLELVRTAAPGWQAWMTVLERRHPSRWGRRMELKHDGAVELAKPRTITPPEEKRATVLELLATVADGAGLLNPDPKDP